MVGSKTVFTAWILGFFKQIRPQDHKRSRVTTSREHLSPFCSQFSAYFGKNQEEIWRLHRKKQVQACGNFCKEKVPKPFENRHKFCYTGWKIINQSKIGKYNRIDRHKSVLKKVKIIGENIALFGLVAMATPFEPQPCGQLFLKQKLKMGKFLDQQLAAWSGLENIWEILVWACALPRPA